MADDNRSNDPRDLDAQDLAEMTRAFLAKGGSIVQCAPGASENVVYRKGGFRRRSPNDAKAANGQVNGQVNGQPGAPAAANAPGGVEPGTAKPESNAG